MSEFSASYHLQSNDMADGIQLLQASGMSGFVFPAQNNWITILPNSEASVKNRKLISASRGVMVYYAMAGDFGCEVGFYLDGEEVTQYQCSWADDVSVINVLNKDLLISRLGLSIEPNNQAMFDIVLTPTNLESVWENNPAEFIASSIGLTNYEWLSFDSMLIDQEEGESNYPGVVFVE